jgi:hypothetical protein
MSIPALFNARANRLEPEMMDAISRVRKIA